MSELAPGDLCTIVRTSHDTPSDVALNDIGTTVVLITRMEPADVTVYQRKFAPFWRCSGVPHGCSGISHLALRKIPPAPLADEPTEEELTV